MDQEGRPDGDATPERGAPPTGTEPRRVAATTASSWTSCGLLAGGGLSLLAGVILGGINVLRWMGDSLPYQDPPADVLQRQAETLATTERLIMCAGLLVTAGMPMLIAGVLLIARHRSQSRNPTQAPASTTR